MSLITVEGKFKDGQIQLGETPAGFREARVLVTFLSSDELARKPQLMTFGMLRVDGRPESTEADFKLPEWHPKPEDLLDE